MEARFLQSPGPHISLNPELLTTHNAELIHCVILGPHATVGCICNRLF